MSIGAYLSCDENRLNRNMAVAFAFAVGKGGGSPARMTHSSRLILAQAQVDGGWKPVIAPSGHSVLLKGYISNRNALRAALRAPEADDATLYALGWALWGDAIDLRAIGEFATILAHPTDPILRLVRSPISAPPLHFWQDKDRLIAASTPQAIFATGEVTREVDEQKIADSLYLNYREGTRGWFRGVTRIATGSRVILTPTAIKTEDFYDVCNVTDVRFANDREYLEAADALMREAIRAVLDGFSNPAVSLSGGYDSQAVAAYALRERPGRPLLGFTSVPEPGWDGRVADHRFGDEGPYAKALAKMYPDLKLELVDAANLGFDHKLRELFEAGSIAPRNGVNLTWIHQIHATAKARGADVLLTGSKGNATFSFAGNGAIPNWLATGQWRRLAREIRLGGALSGAPRRFVSQAFMPLMPDAVWRKIAAFRRITLPDKFENWCPMTRQYADDMQVEMRARSMDFDATYRPKTTTKDWRAAVFGNGANEGGDIFHGFEMIHGLPVRDPTAYRPLVEFCMGIPDDQFLRNGKKRWLAKRLLKDKIPKEVLQERRRGAQAADWHLRIGRQKDKLIEELDWLMEDPKIAKRIDLASLKQALIDFPTETPIGTPQAHRLQLALTRGLTTARFIRYVEGRNDF
ncbi:MAG: asparagine synthase-related protein [Microgenomates group bacterium]